MFRLARHAIAARAATVTIDDKVLTTDRRQPDADFGLLQQLRRLLSARTTSQPRKLVTATGLTGQPVEVCEVRAMLAGDGLDATTEVDVAYTLISDADFSTQIDNALQFVDANSDALEFVIFINGQEVDRSQLLPDSQFGAEPANGLPIPSESATAVALPPLSPDNDIPTDQSGGAADELAANAGVPTAGAAVGDGNANAVDIATNPGHQQPPPHSLEDLSSTEDGSAEWAAPEEQSTSNQSPSPSETVGQPNIDFTWAWDAADDSVAASHPLLSDNGSAPQQDTAPTTITTVIKTESGILVLHQTSAVSEFAVTNSSNFKSVQRFILLQVRELRQSKVRAVQQQAERILAAEQSATISELDFVFANSGRLFDDLQNSAASQEASQHRLADTVAAFDELPNKQSGQETASVDSEPRRISPRTTPWVLEVRRIFSESADELIVSQFTVSPVAEVQAEVILVEKFVQTGRREVHDGVFGVRLFWSATLHDKKQRDEFQLVDVARQAVPPTDSSSDLRNAELSRSLNFVASLEGESAITIPRRLPELPVQTSDAKSLSTRLLYWINPRGPPDSEQPTGLSRHEAVLLQHQRLKHSIAPRSPSTGFIA